MRWSYHDSNRFLVVHEKLLGWRYADSYATWPWCAKPPNRSVIDIPSVMHEKECTFLARVKAPLSEYFRVC
jgi:hypothetical protein